MRVLRNLGGVVVAFLLATAASGLLLNAQLQQLVGTWSAGGHLADNRIGAASVTLPDGRTLIAGGTAADGIPTDTIIIYNPADGGVASAGQLIGARVGHTATLLKDGRVLFAGGAIDGAVTADLEIFNPATATSALIGWMTQPRRGHAAALISDGTVLIVGGSTLDGVVLQSAEIFNPADESIVPAPENMHERRVGASATTLIDGRVLVAGGSDGSTDLASAEIFDPYFQTFMVADTTLSVARSGHTALLLAHNNSVLIAGGSSNGAPETAADLFVPAAFPDPYSYGIGRFAATNAMSAARSGAIGGPAQTDGYAFVAGGGAEHAEVYRFATIKTDKDDYAPGERAVISGSGWQPGELVTLLFQEDPAVHEDYVVTVEADGLGNIYWDQWAPEQHDLDVRFYLLARDSVSRAQITFTDGQPNAITLDPATRTVAPGGDGVYLASVDMNGNNTACTVNLEVLSGLHPSMVVSFTGGSNPVTLNPGDTDFSRNLTIHTTAATPPATYVFTVRATRRSGGGCQPNPAADGTGPTATATLIVQSVDSTPPVITPLVVGTLGNNGWYTSDVNVSFTVVDNESAITSQSPACSTTTTINSDTAGTVITCTATSAGGTSTNSVTIKRDALAPNAPTGARNPAGAWSHTDVTVSFTSNGDNGPSGVAFCTPNSVLTLETAGTDVQGTCTDNAGNVSGISTVTVKIDKTKPMIAGSPSPAANAFGWNNTNVVVSFTCTDAGSGVATDTVAGATISTEGVNQSVTNSGSCVDAAGNIADSATVSGINIDKTAPMAPAGTTTPPANVNGWNNSSPVAVSFGSNGDAGVVQSGIDSCTASSNVSGETSGSVVTGTCVDKAGNTSLATMVTVRIDLTKPVITGGRTPAANAFGWNNTDVVATFTCGDAGPVESGIATDTVAGTTLSTEGVNQSATNSGACVDKAGNAADSATVSGINIDKTPPMAPTGTTTPPANANGWNNSSPVAVSFGSNGDAGAVQSGIDSCTPSSDVSGETSGSVVAGTCVDKAGNTSLATMMTVKIDLTKPVITGGRSPAANAFGWNNTDVVVSFTCTDAGSGIETDTVDGATLSTEGVNQSVTNSGSCVDAAGNIADPVTVSGINIDKTAPMAPTSATTPPANASGWHNSSPVAVSFGSNGDAGAVQSGIDSCTPSSDVSGETSGSIVTGTCVDKAGNTSLATMVTVKIDLTKPVIIGARSPAANAFGWNNTDVVVSFTCTDAGSGVATDTVAGATISTEGLNQSATNSGSCVDAAGNIADSVTVSGINIDKTAPMAPTSTTTPPANANGWNNSSPVAVSFGSNGDAGAVQSGIDSCTASSAISGETSGTVVTGTCVDKAGNTSTATMVTVKIDLTKPVISGARSPSANAFGWNNTDVVATFTCSDAGSVESGIATDTVAGATIGTEGVNQSVTNGGACVDKAGNVANSVTVSGINIDKSKPNAPTGAKNVPSNGAGWNKTDVTVSFTHNGDIGLSGIDSCTPASALTAETGAAGTNVVGTCSDKAGNASNATMINVKIDKTSPSVNVLGVANGGVYVFGSVPVANCGTSDGLSGVASPATLTLTGGVPPGVGTFTAQCIGGTDVAGNATPPVVATYTIQYAASGTTCNGQPGRQMLQPINFTGNSVFARKGSSTVPAKFRVCGADGVSIGPPVAVVSSFVLYGTYNGTIEPFPNELAADSTTPDAAFRWSASDQQWIFNISLKNLTPGVTYVYRVYLNDGTHIQFQFGVK